MGPFRDNAFYLLVWRATLTVLVAVVVMATSAISLKAALLVGAHFALLFALVLVLAADRLDENRVLKTGAWRMLMPGQRPAGVAGRRWARNYLKEIDLRFAKAASAIAVALAASALAVVGE